MILDVKTSGTDERARLLSWPKSSGILAMTMDLFFLAIYKWTLSDLFCGIIYLFILNVTDRFKKSNF
jgi:hypothetical protein